MKIQKPKPYKCRQCGHRWVPRSATVVCPGCRSHYWNKNKTTKIGRPRKVAFIYNKPTDDDSVKEIKDDA